VQDQEAQEMLVVFQANTLVDPHAMVVHLLDAHVAETAVLGTGWLLELAGLAVFLCKIHNVLKFEAS
jgi:hypothetical protein